MIRVDVDETFPITAQVLDTDNSLLYDQQVYYEITDSGDNFLSPRVSGIMTESTTSSGIYMADITIDTSGYYRVYATCSGVNVGSEDIVVNEENIYDLVKQNRHYNIGVEEVLRSNSIATVSQTTRKVAVGNTDYIINRIKLDSESDWSSSTVASGNVYAWYKNETDSVPYKMGGSL